MSSAGFDTNAAPLRTSAERILMALKMHGSMTTASLARRLGTSGEAARQHLVRLAEDGLVEATSAVKGIGRPAQNWHLTSKALVRFPDTHAALTVQLLQIIRSELGSEALDALIATRERQMFELYGARLAKCRSLRARLARLAELRSEEGYMAQVIAQGSGAYLFIENHCPICAAAKECQQFCRAEKSLFETVLGSDVAIERIEHVIAGAARCVYRITPLTDHADVQPA
jgi:predicted ArsR family transcriptional regulator